MLVCVSGPMKVTGAQSSELVFLQHGTMPILLTAPHGGASRVPGVPERVGGINPRDTNASDIRTRELTLALSSGLEAAFCERPYLVVAEFHRRYLDVNRAEAEAFEHPDALPHYAAYHAGIRGFVDEIRTRYPGGSIMFDVHGQSGDPSKIHRGTRDGLTVTRLLSQHGEEALVGSRSVFGELSKSGYEVFPPNTPPGNPPEDERWNGGYTVGLYGSHNSDGIDAIQIESGLEFRRPGTFDALARELTKAIAAFYTAYLSDQPRCDLPQARVV
jgi:N-formylglutamate amidohydrolase